MNLFTCEQVSDGHPDKICDQISDAVVSECLKNDKYSRVAIETMVKDNNVIIAGELTSNYSPDYPALVRRVFDNIGVSRLGYDPDKFNLNLYISQQSPDIAQGVDVGGAGDQGMMFGYATNETPELLPIPFVLATKFLMKLKEVDFPYLRADAKAQVTFDYDNYRIETFLCSTQTTEDADPQKVKNQITTLMKDIAVLYQLNTDFNVLVNPTGRFVIGGPFADTGVTGRKLACDGYGGAAHIGGGAMSGKDPSKVDRSAAYAARKIAKDIVKTGKADKCEIQLAYAIGVAEPVSVHVECFGTNHDTLDNIESFVRLNYDLTPNGIINSLGLREVDYNAVSAYGHFIRPWLPWEV